jgi:hypothetical protein
VAGLRKEQSALINHLRSLARTLFRIRRPRAVPPARAKPGVGARITQGEYRMIVQAGMTDEMWEWLASLGWRELRSGEQRLHYKALSTALVNRLYDVAPDDRQKVLLVAIREATRPQRPVRALAGSPTN